MMYCVQCNRSFPQNQVFGFSADQLFCKSCGGLLTEADLTEDKFPCPSCRKLVSRDAKTCQHCAFDAFDLEHSIEPVSILHNRQKKNISNKVILVVVLIIGAVVVGVLLLRDLSGTATNGKLTNEKAQRELEKWIKSINGSGSVRVIGIQEDAPHNSAGADIQFSNLQYSVNQPLGAGQTRTEWSGGGTAYFIRYNDGRWVLSSVYTSQGAASKWSEGIRIYVDD